MGHGHSKDAKSSGGGALHHDFAGSGELHHGHHGDPSRDSHFWVYPRHSRLITPRWDTYNAESFCSNSRLVKRHGNGIREYACLGHFAQQPAMARNASDEVDEKLAALFDMGFDLANAKEALLREHGDLDAAALFLASQPDVPTEAGLVGAAAESLQLPDMPVRMESAEMAEWWCRDVPPQCVPAEYRAARAKIAVSPELMSTSTNAHALKAIDRELREKPLRESFDRTALDAVRAAWQLDSDKKARSHYATVPGAAEGCMYEGAMRFVDDLRPWDRRCLHAALRGLVQQHVDAADRFPLQLMLGLMRRGANECSARRRWVLGQVVGAYISALRAADSDSAEQDERSRLHAALWHEIDEIKDQALQTVFIWPTVQYFDAVGDTTMSGDVDVHGANTYLCVLMACLGVRLNRAPLMHDEAKGIAEFAEAKGDLTDVWLPHLWQMSSLGRKPPYRLRSAVRGRVARNQFYFRGHCAYEIADLCVDSSSSAAKSRQRLAVYLEQFASYFGQDFVTQRLINFVLQDDQLSGLTMLVAVHVIVD